MESIVKLSQIQWNHLDQLINSSSSEGHSFLKLMKAQYLSGDNRFEYEGEGVYAYIKNQQLIGICGLNKDPYLEDKNVGRIRHLYILPEFRKMGYGRQLIEHVVREAQSHYKLLTLRTFEYNASAFYKCLGFQTDTMIYAATHHYQLNSEEYFPESYLDKIQKGEYELKYC